MNGRRSDGSGVAMMWPHRTHAHRAARVHSGRRHAYIRQRRHREIRTVRINAMQRLNAAAVAHRTADRAVSRSLTIQRYHVPANRRRFATESSLIISNYTARLIIKASTPVCTLGKKVVNISKIYNCSTQRTLRARLLHTCPFLSLFCNNT